MTDLEYFKQNPDATMREYMQYKERMQKEWEEAEKKTETLKKQWYDEHIGHYYRLDFNSSSTILFKLEYKNAMTLELVAKPSYQIYYNPGNSHSLTIESSRWINPLWLPNPYNGDSYQKNDIAEEISKEEWDEYMSKFDIFRNIHNELYNMRFKK